MLATTLIADGTVPAGDSRLVGLFAPPASVGAGQQYALLLTRPGASSWAAQTRGGNACPGTYFLSSSQAGPWSAGSNPMDDIVFAVFVEPPPGGPGAAPPSGPGTAPSTCDGVAATIVGTEGSDQLPGTAGTDVISALGGNDTVSALAANDIVCGGAGKDTLKGGKGKDTLLGQEGRDNLKGGGAKDICKGGKGKDTASKCEVEKSI